MAEHDKSVPTPELRRLIRTVHPGISENKIKEVVKQYLAPFVLTVTTAIADNQEELAKVLRTRAAEVESEGSSYGRVHSATQWLRYNFEMNVDLRRERYLTRNTRQTVTDLAALFDFCNGGVSALYTLEEAAWPTVEESAADFATYANQHYALSADDQIDLYVQRRERLATVRPLFEGDPTGYTLLSALAEESVWPITHPSGDFCVPELVRFGKGMTDILYKLVYPLTAVPNSPRP